MDFIAVEAKDITAHQFSIFTKPSLKTGCVIKEG